MARLAYPATLLTLILSDVIGDDLDVIGSGPTVPDRSTFADARAIFEKYRIWNKLPAAVRDHLTSAAEETPKPGDKIFENARNVVIGSNALAVDAAALEARAARVPYLGAFYVPGGRSAPSGTRSRRHRQGDSGVRQTGEDAGLRHLRRRTDGYHSR